MNVRTRGFEDMLSRGSQTASDAAGTLRAHEFFMRRALDLAHRGERLGEVPVGALVVADDRIIGEGCNQPVASQDPSAHAEILALRAAARTLGNYRLPGATLYVTIEPCLMCCGALVHARVHRLVFGAREPRAGAVCSQAALLASTWLNHQVTVVEGVLAEDCGALMRQFFRRCRQVPE